MNEQKIYFPVCGNGMGEGKLSWALCLVGGLNGWTVHLDGINDSHAGRCMNVVASRFLKTDCTDWLNIDTDTEFTPEHVRRIMSHDAPLVYGIYPKKDEKTEPCTSTFATTAPRADGLIEVARSGRGFMRVQRAVLEAMKEENGGPAKRYHNHGEIQWEFFPSGAVDIPGCDDQGFQLREWLSEDWYFCDRARALGVPVVVDPRIVLGHEGTKMYRFRSDQVHDSRPLWMQIPGWFSEEDAKCMEFIADNIPHNGTYAEVGSWMGRSLACMHSLLKAREKDPGLLAVDTFHGTINEGETHAEIVRQSGGSVRGEFDKTMMRAGIGDSLCVMECTSAAASLEIDHESLDAVFIDADHSYEAASTDIHIWRQKVKRGGIISGHDINRESVRRAVNEAFDGEVFVIGNCWLAFKP